MSQSADNRLESSASHQFARIAAGTPNGLNSDRKPNQTLFAGPLANISLYAAASARDVMNNHHMSRDSVHQ
jgi:hypothetical protein